MESARSNIAEIQKLLPKPMGHAVQSLVEASPTSQFFYNLSKENYQLYLYLIERNVLEEYMVCHCFSTDIFDTSFAYESMSLSSIQALSKMENELSFT